MTAKREVTAVYVTYPLWTLRWEFKRPKQAHEFARRQICQVRILRELVVEREIQ